MTDKDVKAKEVMDIDAAVRQRIKSVRTQQGFTQAAVAEQLGIVPQQYHKYESGVLRLSAGMMARIASVLDVSVLDLMPEAGRSQSKLGADRRIDLLKQEINMMILDQTSEEMLVAIQTIVRASSPVVR